MIDSSDARPVPGRQPLSTPAEAASPPPRRRCAHCSGPFGLVRRRRAGRQFCSASCMDAFDDTLRRSVQARARWLEFLDRRPGRS